MGLLIDFLRGKQDLANFSFLAFFLGFGLIFFCLPQKAKAENELQAPFLEPREQELARQLESMIARAELLEETKKVRRLELEILELEAKARGKGQLQRKELSSKAAKELTGNEQEQKLVFAQLPRVQSVEGKGRFLVATLLWSNGQAVRLKEGESFGPLRLSQLSRDEVFVDFYGRNYQLEFVN